MKKTIIICGLIAGLIVTSWMFATMAGINIQGSMLLGYTTMLVAFSLIFVAIKNARDKYGDGIISFGKGFKIGLLITLVASTIYVIVWMIDYHYFIPDFYEKYTSQAIANLKAHGASAAEIQKNVEEAKAYNNPLFVTLMTYMEILPVGLLISIIAALVLKRKQAKENISIAV